MASIQAIMAMFTHQELVGFFGGLLGALYLWVILAPFRARPRHDHRTYHEHYPAEEQIKEEPVT